MIKEFLALGFLAVSLGLLFKCNKPSRNDGAFLGEPDFDTFTKDYCRSVTDAEAILQEYCQKNGERWWYIPYKIVYATEGGYLFLDGEFKINIQASGYFVDQDGQVLWRSLGWAISVEDYLNKIELDRKRGP